MREETAQQASDLRAKRSGLASRIEVLEGLERSHEGFGAGAREVFALMEQAEPGPWGTVVGIVADFLTVRREYAPLIDLALGERRSASWCATPTCWRRRCGNARSRFPAASASCRSLPSTHARDRPMKRRRDLGTPARRVPMAASLTPAEQVVRCDDPRLADLPERLLGRTLIVRDLAAARAVGRAATPVAAV